MKHPSIRVVMITFNGDRFIEEQLKSIAEQAYLDHLHIQDDHSDPTFYRKLESLSAKLSIDYRLHRNTETLGVIANIKKAIEANSTAQFIALCDQDDIWQPHKLSTLGSMLKPSSSEIPTLVYHDAAVIDSNGRIMHDSFWHLLGQSHYEHRLETFLFGNFVTGGSSLFNKAVSRIAHTIPEDLKTLHDAWLALYALTFGEIIRVEQALNQYRFHDHNVAFKEQPKEKRAKKKTKKAEEFLKDELLLAERFYLTFGDQMADRERQIFQRFLHLKNKPFFYKKIRKYLTLRKFKA